MLERIKNVSDRAVNRTSHGVANDQLYGWTQLWIHGQESLNRLLCCRIAHNAALNGARGGANRRPRSHWGMQSQPQAVGADIPDPRLTRRVADRMLPWAA
jgi:hypothetical protein